MYCLRPSLSFSLICKAHSWRGYSPFCSLPNTTGLQIVRSRKKEWIVIDTVCIGPLADLLPAIWLMDSQFQNQILQIFLLRNLSTQWLKYCSPNSGKTTTDIRVSFYLIQVCRILLLSTNMSYISGLIARSAEQPHSMLPPAGVERTRQFEIW